MNSKLQCLFWALDRFKNYLLGQHLSILSDHKALIGAFKDANSTKSAQSCPARWADKLHLIILPLNIRRLKKWDPSNIYPDIHRAIPYPFHMMKKNFVCLTKSH